MRTLRSIRLWLLALVMLAVPASSFAGVFISVNFAPPPLPVYEQPLCPGDGYIWTPGYWAYGDDGYYWVPGTWVLAPQVGFLWTPGYWGWGDGVYLWHTGYWGPHVGFYGGVDYGFGYVGHGYEGGRWDHDHFYYNRTVNNVNVTNIHNVYNKTVINNVNVTRVSYNGGNGGVRAQPTHQEQLAVRDHHVMATSTQTQHEVAARSNRQQFASVNHGQPPVAATPRPGAFNNGVPAGRGGSNNNVARPEPNRGAQANNVGRPEPNRGAPANNGQRPLITAHGNNVPQTARNLPPPNRSYNPQGGRPANNGQANTTPQRSYNNPPRNQPESRGNPVPQRSYSPPPQRQQAPPPQRSYNAPPQRQQAPPPQRSYNAPPQREYAPQPHYNAPPQHQQSAPPQHQQSAPRESAPRGGEPHGGGHEPHGGGGERRR